MKPIITSVLVWLVILLGVSLRTFNADRYPIDNNDDGLYYAWAGSGFWDHPLYLATHSIFEKGNPNLIWRSQFKDYLPVERMGLKIVSPWFDHPPLGTVLIGLPARMLNYPPFAQIPHLIVRLPALIASLFTLWLTYLLAKDLFGRRVGFWSLLFFATIPYMVMAHRQSFLENLMTPIWLWHLVVLRSWLKTPSRQKWWLIIATGFITGWFKVVGLVVPLLSAGWLFFQKKISAGWKLVFVAAASLLTYLSYGLLTNKQAFLTALSQQSGRGTFTGSFLYSLTHPEFYGSFNDGWYLLGLILLLTFLFTASKKPGQQFINWMATGWLIVIYLIAGTNTNSPWFKYPLLPLMSIAIGHFIASLWQKPKLWQLLILWLLGFTVFQLINLTIPGATLRFLTLLVMMPAVFDWFWPGAIWQRFNLITARCLILAAVLLNLIVIFRFSAVNCQLNQCLLPQKIIVNLP
jgi:4-amino-4-deoxy-L-arabinose transferase-like glycosyltransferase